MGPLSAVSEKFYRMRKKRAFVNSCHLICPIQVAGKEKTEQGKRYEY